MDKIAVIFPGVGYNTDRPLLYYSWKLFQQAGYEIVKLDYSDLPEDMTENQWKMSMGVNQVIDQTHAQLKNIDFSKYKKIAFVSKSVGTVAAAEYAKTMELEDVLQIYFTPLMQTFLYTMPGQGIVFHGDKDPLVPTLNVQSECDKQHLELFVTKNANHSLEVGDAIKDLHTMQMVLMDIKLQAI